MVKFDVSIVMPAYNAGKYIEQSILSVLEQTHPHWELLIVNDGSTDDTQAIAENYAAKDDRIKVINQKNSRLGAARNAAINRAVGTWIAFLDSDDLWEAVKLEKQLALSKSHPEVSVIYTDGWIFADEDPKKLIAYPTITGEVFSPEKMYRKEYIANYIPVLSVMAKRELVEKIGKQETSKFFYGCEDWDYWLRMAIAGGVFYGLDEKLFYYRRHSSNMSSNELSMRLGQGALWIKNFYPTYISLAEFNSFLKHFLNDLITDLLKNNRIEDALYIINEHSKISVKHNYLTVKKMIQILGKAAVLPTRIYNKLNPIR
jgi:teichuronic acid biosynthesis glycosyltransferase TuaG